MCPSGLSGPAPVPINSIKTIKMTQMINAISRASMLVCAGHYRRYLERDL